MTRAQFRRLVTEAVETIPDRFRQHLQNVALVVEDYPSADVLRDLEIEPPDTLFGLYQGTPLTERHWDHGNTLPDRITIYQGPIEEACDTEDDVVTEVGETLIHEVGHFFGLSEEELEDIEVRYWQGRMGDAESDDFEDEDEDEGEDGR